MPRIDSLDLARWTYGSDGGPERQRAKRAAAPAVTPRSAAAIPTARPAQQAASSLPVGMRYADDHVFAGRRVRSLTQSGTTLADLIGEDV